ncbi:carbohydrate-binding family 9-like protein [Pedobacter arcticus]|uniref:carbohydrate-binding family 9-like protein n=1 Tax=Pedobacter arcticus TaxID=752140 RepID=UPI0002F89C84|nr:carbohydrate-binding family 9-like protein [Pedobacter arcticus]
MQQEINIPYYATGLKTVDIFTNKLDQNIKYNIDCNPWNYEFSGEADVAIAYTDGGILLKFNVIEENVLARFTKINDPVYKDSCVEFFIALNNEDAYYNFEFNCTGTCLAGYGTSAEDRKLLSVEKIKQIEVTSSFKSLIFNEKEMVNWQLTMLIPNEVFEFHQIENFNGKHAKMNFYKCGDDLPKPHYLCWSPITNTAQPNFHLPNYFGKAVFLKN